MDGVKEYIYRDRKTGEIYISTQPVDEPDLELVAVVEVRPYGRGGTTGTAHT